MQHLIKKQSVSLQLPKQLDAFRMQQLAGTHFWRDVLPALEKIFDELSDENEFISIDQLEIDLGVISEKEMIQERWNDAILSKIGEQIKSKIGIKKKEGKDYVSRATALNSCGQWLFYMEKGILPWNRWQVNEAWYKEVLEALAVDFNSIVLLRKLIAEKPVVARRIVLQHKKDFLIALIEIITTQKQQHLEKAIAELIDLFSGAGSIGFMFTQTKMQEREIWEQVLQFSVAEKKLTDTQLIEAVLIAHLPKRFISHQSFLANHASRLPNLVPVLKKLQDNPRLLSEKDKPAISSKKEIKSETEQPASELIGEEGIFVPYAGLVLVHPFLHSLFKKLQWVKEGKFENAFIQQKALLLLHYLATGKTVAEEFELVVPEVLCAFTVEMPVEKYMDWDTGELTEADNMLQAVIEQWDVLKNTSANGLREGFLQRNGKLFRKNDKLYLQVESNTIDVLLDQLPWNLSMIKLPWMKELLRVEWR
jgi:hypothetical protein